MIHYRIRHCFNLYIQSEKIQNHIFKDIFIVHRKASDLAVNSKLGSYPLYYFCYENMFKYYIRLRNMESNTTYNNALLVSAFKEDKELASKKSYISWQNKIFNLQQKLNLTSLDISHKDLISQESWNTCIQCHDFHGNHKYALPEKMSDTIPMQTIQNYFDGGEDPYGKVKKYIALSQEEWLKSLDE